MTNPQGEYRPNNWSRTVKGLVRIRRNLEYLVCKTCRAHFRTVEGVAAHFFASLCENEFEFVMYTQHWLDMETKPTTPWGDEALYI